MKEVLPPRPLFKNFITDMDKNIFTIDKQPQPWYNGGGSEHNEPTAFRLVSGGILKGEAMLRIVEPRLRIHEVPLENIQIVNSCVTVELDDESENRWRLRFVFATLRLTTMDCAETTAIMAEMDGDICYPDGRDPDAWGGWIRFLLEKTDSPLVLETNANLREYDHDERNLHHYVMAVGDNLWEIVSEPVEIIKITKS